MFKVVLIRPPYSNDAEWLFRTQREAVQKAATLSVLNQCPYRVNEQGEYVVHSNLNTLARQAFQQHLV